MEASVSLKLPRFVKRRHGFDGLSRRSELGPPSSKDAIFVPPHKIAAPTC